MSETGVVGAVLPPPTGRAVDIPDPSGKYVERKPSRAAELLLSAITWLFICAFAGAAVMTAGVFILAGVGWALIAVGVFLFAVAGLIRTGIVNG